MSTEQPSLQDAIPAPHEQALADEGAKYGRTTAPAERPAQRRAATPRCQCGADITEWHAPAEARRLLRLYGRGGEMLACPECIETGPHGDDARGVARAVKHRETESSVETLAPAEQLAVMTRPEVDR